MFVCIRIGLVLCSKCTNSKRMRQVQNAMQHTHCRQFECWCGLESNNCKYEYFNYMNTMSNKHIYRMWWTWNLQLEFKTTMTASFVHMIKCAWHTCRIKNVYTVHDWVTMQMILANTCEMFSLKLKISNSYRGNCVDVDSPDWAGHLIYGCLKAL